MHYLIEMTSKQAAALAEWAPEDHAPILLNKDSGGSGAIIVGQGDDRCTIFPDGYVNALEPTDHPADLLRDRPEATDEEIRVTLENRSPEAVASDLRRLKRPDRRKATDEEIRRAINAPPMVPPDPIDRRKADRRGEERRSEIDRRQWTDRRGIHQAMADAAFDDAEGQGRR